MRAMRLVASNSPLVAWRSTGSAAIAGRVACSAGSKPAVRARPAGDGDQQRQAQDVGQAGDRQDQHQEGAHEIGRDHGRAMAPAVGHDAAEQAAGQQPPACTAET
jgi:hypothetical protein